MDVNMEYYKIFYYVAGYGNFTKAAHALGSSQPNVTRAMNCLEQQLGCTLFIRSNRGIQLTPEGERLYPHVAAAMSQILKAQEEITESTGLARGNVSIGVSDTALNIFLPAKLKAFHMKYPGIRLKLYNCSTPQAADAVRSGKTDFAVVTTPADISGGLKQINLKTYREIPVAGKMFSELAGREVLLAELNEYPIICLGKETMTYRFYHQLFLSCGLELAPDIEAAAADQLLTLVKCELGIAFIPDEMARDAIEEGSVIPLLLKEEIPERNVCLVYDPGRPCGAAAAEFKRMITD